MFGREVHLESGDKQQSLAEKALFSMIAGKFTQKTFARVNYQVFGGRCPGLCTPRFLLLNHSRCVMMEIIPAYRFSMTDFPVSQVRVKYSTRFVD